MGSGAIDGLRSQEALHKTLWTSEPYADEGFASPLDWTDWVSLSRKVKDENSLIQCCLIVFAKATGDSDWPVRIALRFSCQAYVILTTRPPAIFNGFPSGSGFSCLSNLEYLGVGTSRTSIPCVGIA